MMGDQSHLLLWTKVIHRIPKEIRKGEGLTVQICNKLHLKVACCYIFEDATFPTFFFF